MWNPPIVLSLALLIGCGTAIHATVINPAPRPMSPRDPATLEVMTAAPTRPHVDLVYFEAEQQSSVSLDTTADFIAHLRHRAAAIGCDALVLGGTTNARAGRDGSIKGLVATCVVYTDEEAAATLTSE